MRNVSWEITQHPSEAKMFDNHPDQLSKVYFPPGTVITLEFIADRYHSIEPLRKTVGVGSLTGVDLLGLIHHHYDDNFSIEELAAIATSADVDEYTSELVTGCEGVLSRRETMRGLIFFEGIALEDVDSDGIPVYSVILGS